MRLHMGEVASWTLVIAELIAFEAEGGFTVVRTFGIEAVWRGRLWKQHPATTAFS